MYRPQVNNAAMPFVKNSRPEKVWIFPEKTAVPEDVVKIALGSPVIAELLVQRGIKNADEALQFLDESSYTPSAPAELPDMSKAVERIVSAIKEKQSIIIYGDYDVDGVTGTSVLLSVLRRLGANVDYYIPNRVSEGYGLNLKAVSVLVSKKKAKLIITCDCGVSNFAEINFARSLGADTLVLDHHTMPDVLPPAVAVIHPKRLPEDHPLFHLPGVGVAYKVCEALLESQGYAEEAQALLDFVTLGMIADLVPLVKENRYLVRVGLEKLVRTPRIGLRALLSQVNGAADTDLVGFGIAPRINAAGRLSDANKAVELLTTEDEDRANELAAELQRENARRQELCEEIFLAADNRVQTTPGLESLKCIAIYDPTWHHGVVGIVASRLVEKYNRPVFIGQLDAEENVVKASARGIEQLDLYEVLKANDHMLIKWGGHKMAAGFTVEASKAKELCRSLDATCARMLNGKPILGVIKIDMEVQPDVVSLDLARQLKVLSPFGMGNKKPRLCMRGLVCSNSRVMGKEGKHARIMLRNPATNEEFECVMWNAEGWMPAPSQSVDLVFTPEVNNYNGKDRLQLVVTDWRVKFDGREITSIDQIEGTESSFAVPKDATTTQAPPPPVPAAPNIESIVETSPSVSTSTESEVLPLDCRPDNTDSAPAVTINRQTDSDAMNSSKQVWKDLRNQGQPLDLLKKGAEKLGDNLAIFCEVGEVSGATVKKIDRVDVSTVRHLMFWQYPPSQEVFKQVLSTVKPTNIYLVGAVGYDFDDPGAFLSRLIGLCRYAVREKEGRVSGDKLTALMGCTKMSLALGLTLLKRIHLIDWFAEDGYVNLDLLEHSGGKFEDYPEFLQLSKSLAETKCYRAWCASQSLKEIQLSIVQNGLLLAPQIEDGESSVVRERNEHVNADGP